MDCACFVAACQDNASLLLAFVSPIDAMIHVWRDLGGAVLHAVAAVGAASASA